jgi:hypothetical protein
VSVVVDRVDGDFPGYMGAVAGAVSRKDGTFEAADVPAGEYGLHATTRDGLEVVVKRFKAGDGELALTLQAPGSMAGSLVGFKSAPTVSAHRLDPGQPNAGEWLRHAASPFRFDRLPPGRYVVDAQGEDEAAFAVVEVLQGKTTQVTLTSTGTAAVAGRVVDFESGVGVGEMRCTVNLPTGERFWRLPGNSVETAADGRLDMPAVFAGDVVIECHDVRNDAFASTQVGLKLAPGEKGVVELKVVKRPPQGGPFAESGIHFDYVPAPAVVHAVKDPALAAGVQEGDVVTAVDGVSVTELTGEGVQSLLAVKPLDKPVELTIDRGGKTLTVRIVLVEWNP